MTEKQYTPEKQKPVEKKQKIVAAPIKKEEKAEVKEEVKKEIEAKISEIKKTDETKEEKKEEVKEEKKKKQEIVKKDKAVMDGRDLGMSKKHSMSICDFIRNRKIEDVIPRLEQVIKLNRPIKMKGEIPHRHGKGMAGGRYPVNASKVFIKLLKTLNANAQVNGIENAIISVAIANDASRPFKRGGSARFKRTNVYLEAKENKKKAENKSENKEKKK